MPTPSVAFNLTCAFNPARAKLLFNVEKHGVFRVTCEKCISSVQSKSDSLGKRNKATPQRREENQNIVLTQLSPQGSQEDASCRHWWCVWLWVCSAVINYMSLVTCVCCVYFQYMKNTSIWLYVGKHAGWYVINALWVHSFMCGFPASVRCHWARSVCGWQVFAGLPLQTSTEHD